MRKDLLPYYLQNITIRGFEETPEEKAAREAKEAEEKEEEEEEEEKAANTDGLKSALAKERKAAKEAQKALRAAQKRLDELDAATKSETDQAKDKAARESATAQKLATRLRDMAIDNAIIKLGGKLKFRDMDDALKLLDRTAIEVDQDPEAPETVEVDEASVTAALKKLAAAKPHLIIADGQEERSGSKFGGPKKSAKEVDDDALRAKYPALNRSGHTS